MISEQIPTTAFGEPTPDLNKESGQKKGDNLETTQGETSDFIDPNEEEVFQASPVKVVESVLNGEVLPFDGEITESDVKNGSFDQDGNYTLTAQDKNGEQKTFQLDRTLLIASLVLLDIAFFGGDNVYMVVREISQQYSKDMLARVGIDIPNSFHEGHQYDSVLENMNEKRAMDFFSQLSSKEGALAKFFSRFDKDRLRDMMSGKKVFNFTLNESQINELKAKLSASEKFNLQIS